MEEKRTMLNPNIQLFAEEADPTPPAAGDDGSPKAPEKTFTQAELDDILKDRLAREKKNLPSKEEIKAFKEWQDSQKTKEQKDSEERDRIRREAEEYKQKVQAYDRERAVIKSGVSAEYAEFVAFSAGRLVGDNTDFDAALASFLKSNPQYKGQPVPTRTGLPQGGGGTPESGVEARFYAKNPDLKH